MDVDIQKIVEKANILGGHCTECNGFLYAEIISTSPLNIQERCLKCGHTVDITEDILKLSKINEPSGNTEYYFSAGSPYPTIICTTDDIPDDIQNKLLNSDNPKDNFIDWYLKMLVEVK